MRLQAALRVYRITCIRFERKEDILCCNSRRRTMDIEHGRQATEGK